MTLELDRIEIESAGPDPAAMAQVLLGQLSGLDGRVPIGEIALALDILAIEVAPLRGLTACLQCDRQKSYGQIVVAARSSSRRRRYSIAHELGHFLNDGHEPTGSAGFDCTGLDMAEPARAGRHLRQEREANAFAIEVLTPRHLLTPHLEGRADLARALEISARFDVSRQAAARRYVRLHPACLAVVFSKDGRISISTDAQIFRLRDPGGETGWVRCRVPRGPAILSPASRKLMQAHGSDVLRIVRFWLRPSTSRRATPRRCSLPLEFMPRPGSLCETVGLRSPVKSGIPCFSGGRFPDKETRVPDRP